MVSKNFVLASATLLGTIIGAGVFSIPYLFSKSGIFTLLFYFLILGASTLYLHLFLGEVVLRTKEKSRLVGYAEKYLGSGAKNFVAISTIIGTIGSLLAYIILGGIFLAIIFPNVLSQAQFSVILWFLMSLFVLGGMKFIAPIEFFMNVGFLVIIFLVFFFSFPKIEASNFVLSDFRYFFLPFGALFFSLVGWNAIPEIEPLLKKKSDLKRVIIFSVVFSIIFYFLFGLIISGVSGGLTSEDAFSGLIQFFGHKIMVLGAIFGIFSIVTSFLVLANYLKNTLIYDFGVPSFLSFSFASFLPLILFLAGLNKFLLVISLVGTVIGFVEGGAILLIFKKAKEKGERAPEYEVKIPKFLFYLIFAVLVLGTITQIIYHF